MAAIKEIRSEVESLRTEIKELMVIRSMMTHDKEIEGYKENHCVLHAERVNKTAAYAFLFVVPTITLQLDVANDLPNRL